MEMTDEIFDGSFVDAENCLPNLLDLGVSEWPHHRLG